MSIKLQGLGQLFVGISPAVTLWESTDANANWLIIDLPTGGAVNVPVVGIGIGLFRTDLGLFNGLTQPELVVMDIDKDSYISLAHSADDVGSLYTKTGVAARTETLSFTATQVKVAFATDTPGTTGLVPATTDVGALGTTVLMWADLFLASGAVVNYNNGNVTLTHAAGFLTLGDDMGFRLGAGGDDVLYHRTATLAANTALTGVIVGTPVTSALAADSLIISNVTAAGDVMMMGNRGGNSEAFLFYDTSAGALYLAPLNGGLAIGLTGTPPAPDNSMVHIWRGSAGTVTADTSSLLVIERSTNASISILIPNTSWGGFIVGDPEGVAAGQLRYDHAGPGWEFFIEAVSELHLTATALNLKGNNLDASGGATDLLIVANTAAALEVAAGSVKVLTIDSRTATDNVSQLTILGMAPTIANVAGTTFSVAKIAALTTTLSTTTLVTAMDGLTLDLGAPTINQSGGAVTVSTASTLIVRKPVAGASVTITNNYIINTDVSGCFLTAAGVWTDASTRAGKIVFGEADPEKFTQILDNVRLVEYAYIDPSDGGFRRIGVIAEEVPDYLAQLDRAGVAAKDLAGLALLGTLWARKHIEALERGR